MKNNKKEKIMNNIRLVKCAFRQLNMSHIDSLLYNDCDCGFGDSCPIFHVILWEQRAILVLTVGEDSIGVVKEFQDTDAEQVLPSIKLNLDENDDVESICAVIREAREYAINSKCSLDDETLKDIFARAETSLKNTFTNEEEFKKGWVYSTIDFKKPILNDEKCDEKCYEILVGIVFYSGFKNKIVADKMNVILKHFPSYQVALNYDEAKITEICNDKDMIGNRKKIEACVKNAKKFAHLIDKYGSFMAYINSFEAELNDENLLKLYADLQKQFSFIGERTAFHFMMEFGMNVLKPDLAVTRVFERLGLITGEHEIMQSVHIGRRFSKVINHPIRYVDAVFSTYAQKGKNCICDGTKPKCEICQLKDYCKYANEGGNI